jgi:hypothetical protein
MSQVIRGPFQVIDRRNEPALASSISPSPRPLVLRPIRNLSDIRHCASPLSKAQARLFQKLNKVRVHVSKSQHKVDQNHKGYQHNNCDRAENTGHQSCRNRALGWCCGSGWGLAFKPNALSGYASPEERWGPGKHAGIGHGARTPTTDGGIRAEPPTRGDVSRTRPLATGLCYGLRALRYSKINGGFAESWILDRDIALRRGFLLWPYAPDDVGHLAVKKPARHCEPQRQEADREAASLRKASRRDAAHRERSRCEGLEMLSVREGDAREAQWALSIAF